MTKVRHLSALLAVLALVSLTGCRLPEGAEGAAPQPLVTLRMAGSTSMTATLRDLAEAYQSRHANVIVNVQEGDSAAGLVELSAGRADLAAVSWHPAGEQVPPRTQAIPIARDALALIVHPRNPVHALALVQIKAIYQGETLNWAAVGGPDLEPTIISREDGSGSRAAFEALALGGERVTLNALVMPSSEAVVDYVATHPAAIGYVTGAELSERIRALDVEGLSPSAANVSSGSYHLSRLLYLYAPAPAPAATQAFVDFVLSPAGQTIIGQHHVPLR